MRRTINTFATTRSFRCAVIAALALVAATQASDVAPKRPNALSVGASLRRQCNTYQQIGCIGDVMSRVCRLGTESLHMPWLPEGVENVHHPLQQTSMENVYLCCCPSPFAACPKSVRHAACDLALERHIMPVYETYAEVMMNKTFDAPMATAINKEMLRSLQNVRKDLIAAPENDKRCQTKLFAPAEPMFDECKISKNENQDAHHDSDDEHFVIPRKGIHCETMTWQWEELGAHRYLSEDMFKEIGCPGE